MQKLTDREKAKQLYIESKGTLPLTEIAQQLKRPPGTVRGWKSKDNWDNVDGTLQNGTERSKKIQPPKKSFKTKTEKKENKSELNITISSELTDKQQLFCMYYLKYFNATKAYQKAYECDYFTASASGSRMLGNVNIKSEIERLKKEQFENIQLDSKAIMQKYVDIAFADITDYIEFGEVEKVSTDNYGNQLKDEDGKLVTYSENYIKLKDSNNLDGTIISEITEGREGIKIKLYDKMKALEWLAKNIVSFKDNLDIDLLNAKIEKEKATVDKVRVEIDKLKGIDNENNEDTIQNFLKATAPQVEDIEELYE